MVFSGVKPAVRNTIAIESERVDCIYGYIHLTDGEAWVGMAAEVVWGSWSVAAPFGLIRLLRDVQTLAFGNIQVQTPLNAKGRKDGERAITVCISSMRVLFKDCLVHPSRCT